MPWALKFSTITTYADGTSLAHSAKDMKAFTSAMNTELENLKIWLHGNKLYLNVAKTTSMLMVTVHILSEKITAEPVRADFQKALSK